MQDWDLLIYLTEYKFKLEAFIFSGEPDFQQKEKLHNEFINICNVQKQIREQMQQPPEETLNFEQFINLNKKTT